MAFCTNCGHQLADGANFCFECGTKANATVASQEERRRVVYEGEIHKCPNCGENLTSLTAICPACGHEFNSVKVDEDLFEFSRRIDSFDNLIANNPKVGQRSGWASWSTGWRIGWVVLNMYTLCLPLLFYAISRVFKNFRFELSPEEKNKAAFIENYVFPNEREAIIEALFFIKAKMTFLSGEPANRNTMYWAKIWSNKANAIYAKASIVLRGDALSESTFAEIQNEKKRIANKCIWRPVIIIGVVATLIIVLCVIGGIKNTIRHNTQLVLPDAMPYSLLPAYEPMYGEITSDNGDKLKISLYQTDKAVYDSYVQGCINIGFVVDAEKKTTSYEAYNESGYHIKVTYNKKETISVVIESPMDFRKITWPTSGVAALIPAPPSVMGSISTDSASTFTAYIANITREQYDAYVDACMDYGFDIDYNRYDDSFNAENKDGTDISLSYQGGNVMYVHLYDSNYSYSQIQSNIDDFNEQMDKFEDMWNWTDTPSTEAAKTEPEAIETIPTTTIPKYNVSICVTCDKNTLFNKYDMKVFVDDVLLGTVAHGDTKLFRTTVVQGTHTLRLEKDNDTAVFGEYSFEIGCDSNIDCAVMCETSTIKIDSVVSNTADSNTIKDSSALIEKGTSYSFMSDQWNVYIATAISNSIIKIENWGKSSSSAKTVKYDYDVGTYRIDDEEIDFAWVDDEHTAFTITLQDKNNSNGGLKKAQTVTFTIVMNESDKHKGSNYDEDIVCYTFQNDDWHLYRAIPLTKTLVKIEVWYRSSSTDKFVYGYDLCVISDNSTNTDFEWTDSECTSFTITLEDSENEYYWKEAKFVAFTVETNEYTYLNVMEYVTDHN